MIKLFRNIRKNLLSEGKTTRYFKYAIGEILLVVIGILIALSINTWNEKQKNTKETQFQLSKLRDNLNSDRTQIKRLISEDSIYISHLVFCVNVLSNELKTNKKAFTDRFQDILMTKKFKPVRGTFDGLIFSGKIELINNQELLEALFMYYNSESYTSWDSAISDYSRNIIAPYIMNFDHIPNVSVPEHENLDFKYFDISKFAIPSKTIEDYKNNLFLINALRIKIQLFEGQKIQYVALQKEIDTIIDQINLELR